MPIISGGVIMPNNGALAGGYSKAGALVANDFASTCTKGSLATDTTNGVLYICTASNGSTTSTWVTVGSQT